MEASNESRRESRPIAAFRYMVRTAAGLGLVAEVRESAVSSFDRVRGGLSALVRRRKARRETFAEASARLRLNENDIADRRRQFHLRSNIWLLVYMLAAAVLVATPVTERPLLHAMNALAVSMIAFSGWLVWHFRAEQVARREFFDFLPFVRSDAFVRRVVGTSVTTALIMVGVFWAIAAYADGPDLHQFTPEPGDASVMFLREVFGPIIDQVWSGGSGGGSSTMVNQSAPLAASSRALGSPLGAMLAPFNAGVLFLGMVFVLYTTIKGTIDSAHDGEVLGKKMSEIWVPIRTVGGAALIMPAVGGYSLIQVAVLWLAVQSIGIGNSVLNAGIEYFDDTGMVTTPHIPSARTLAAQVLKSEVCAAAMNFHYAAAGNPTRIQAAESKETFRSSGELTRLKLPSRPEVTRVDWRATREGRPAFLSPVVCGSVSWTESIESDKGNVNAAMDGSREAGKAILAAQAEAVRQMIVELRPAAEKLATFEPAPAGAIEAAVANYESRLRLAVGAAVKQSESGRQADFLRAMKDGGWIYLPTYYNHLIQMNDTMQGAINALPVTEPMTIDQVETDMVLQNFKDAMLFTDEYLKGRADAPKREYDRQTAEDWSMPTGVDDVRRLISKPFTLALEQFTGGIAGSNLSHITQIKDTGDYIMNIGWTMLLGGVKLAGIGGVALTNVASSAAGGQGVFYGMLAVLVPLLFGLFVTCLAFGAMAAFYIPMIPFVYGVVAVIKWLILVFEAVIAAPIWAVGHIHPDGHDVVGKGEAGYMLIVALLMRPALTVLGFFGAIWLAQPVAGFIHTGFMTAVQGAQYESLTGVGAFIAYTVIYVLLMTQTMHSIFTLANWMPDTILRWIGGHGGSHGIADGAPHESESGARAALVGVVGALNPKKKDTGDAPAAAAPAAAAAAKAKEQAEHMPVDRSPQR